MRHRFQAEQWLPYPLEDVFRFFSDPANLPRLMPRWHKARMEAMKLVPPPNTATEVVAAGAGSRFTISFRPFLFSPVRLRWEAEITDFAWNQHFSDLQRKGPFAYWLHRHSVQPSASNGPSGNGIHGTRVRDEITYQLPLGSLGNIAHRLFVKDQLRRTFAYRQARIIELLSRRRHAG
jgi:ligand-binding SRPBCC domain-containing protein